MKKNIKEFMHSNEFILTGLTFQVNRAEGDYLKAMKDVEKAKERLESSKFKFDTLKEALDKLANPKPKNEQ